MIDTLATRPGSFARRLHHLLRTFEQPLVLSAFERIAHEVPTKALLSLQTHFDTIEHDEQRAIVTKRGRVKVLDNPHQGALGPKTILAIQQILKSALIQSFAQKDSWAGKSVWLHPELGQYTVPLQLRMASDGLINVGRGSWLPTDSSKVIRLFVWWRQRTRNTDLDLSAVLFDKDFRYLGHVSYTNLSSKGMCHSGDVQSTGPEGATEFIDINPNCLPANAAYLAPQIHRYCGESLQMVEAHAG